MKELIFKIVLMVSFFISSASFAQGLNEKKLLTEFNKTNEVALTATEKSNFEKANSELISDLISMEKKKLSKEKRNQEIDQLFADRDKNLSSSLGLNKYSDIKSQTDSNISEIKNEIKQTQLVP